MTDADMNRYRDALIDDEDDDIDMDEWMEMSDQEREHELDSSARQLQEVLDRLTPKQLYAHRRRSALASCMAWRGHIRKGFVPNIAKDFLRQTQIRMVKLRIFNTTGSYPGEA